MFITRKHILRRTFLRGAGATLALPLLDAMIPAATAMAQTAAGQPVPRFVAIFYPHGMAPGYWVPQNVGALPTVFPDGPNDYSMSILKSLEPLRDQLVVLSGLWAKSSEPPEGTVGSDFWVSAAFLTAHKPKRTTGFDINVGSPTIDQTIAQKIGLNSPVHSLQLTAEEIRPHATSCGQGYSCWYTNSISWPEATKPLPMELHPQLVFERLFGAGRTSAERAARRQQNRSIVDALTGQLASLRVDLGADDRRRLDQFITEVREVERRIAVATRTSAAVTSLDQPLEIPIAYDEHIKLHYDLISLGFQTDTTRVATMLGARDYTGRSYPFPVSELFPNGGQSGSFHGSSRHANQPVAMANYARVNRYHVSTMAYLARKLKSIPDGDGTLLDRSLILYGSNAGNSNQADRHDVPHLLVGGANGQLRGGRHVASARRTTTTGNLLLSILDMYGIRQESQGDSTGRLSGLF